MRHPVRVQGGVIEKHKDFWRLVNQTTAKSFDDQMVK